MKLGALGSRNFRLLAIGFLLSNTGWWMLFTAQSWLVLSLTNSPADVGLTGALVYLPSVVLGMAGGVLADRYSKHRIVLFYYAGWATLTALLATLTLSGTALLWHIQLIMAGIGIVMAVGYPAFHPMVAETVKPGQLRSAVSFISSTVQLAALAGPASAGLLINVVGPGGTLLVATLCYVVPLLTLTLMRMEELQILPPTPAERGQVRAGVRYALRRPDVLWPTIMIGLFGMFTTNLPVTLAVYAKSVFESGPGGYGVLTAIVAGGALVGTIISAQQSRTRLRTLVLFGLLLAALYIVAAFAPNQLILCALLLGIGAFTVLLQTSCNSTVLLAAHGSIRGRVMSIYVTVWFCGTAIGGPLLGNIVQHLGPQIGMLMAGVLPGTGTLLIAVVLATRLRGSSRSSIQRWAASPQQPLAGWDESAKPPRGRLAADPWVGLYFETETERHPTPPFTASPPL